MKSDIHPENNRPVVFKDPSTGAQFLVWSTVATKESVKWEDGKEYPLYILDVSSSSHPFYTGQDKALDTEGRAEKFKQRAAKAKK